mgnify:CR=1 FL=1
MKNRLTYKEYLKYQWSAAGKSPLVTIAGEGKEKNGRDAGTVPSGRGREQQGKDLIRRLAEKAQHSDGADNRTEDIVFR